MFVAVRLLFVFRPVTLLNYPEDHDSRCFLAEELGYRVEGPPHPEVLIMGTSRLMECCFDPLAEALALRPEEVMSLSRPTNSFWPIRLLLQRNPGMLDGARVVVIDLLPYQIRERPDFPESDTLFLGYASLRERLDCSELRARVLTAADWLLPLWSERRTVEYWRKGIGTSLLSEGDFAVTMQELARSGSAEQMARMRTFGPGSFLRVFYFLYLPLTPISANEVRALDEIIDMMPEDTQLLLIMPPLIEDLHEALTGLRLEQYTDFQDYMRSMQRPGVTVLFCDEPSAYGFEREDFVEGVHFTDSGYRKLLALFADVINGLSAEGL
ncbi:MAG: hypothetical protein JXR94_18785 [Candidatus Hydrogenedentes bacterium]|nr:hypothetical protein [Candidatus Hydrogenedentota bacterium]